MSDSEEDFMSDAFLAKIAADAAPKPSTSTTYQEKRRRAAAASQARAEANKIRPFREREEEARQEGLKTNLIEREMRARDEGAEVGVGMKMMLKMGYEGGERLGRRRPEDGGAVASGSGQVQAAPSAEDVADEIAAAHGGLGSRKRLRLDSPSLATQVSASSKTGSGGHLLEPLSISIWAGRKGLGARSKAPDAPPPPTPTTIAFLDTSVYRLRGSAEYAEKKAEGQLRSAQKTVLELDARDDKGFSILHLSPADASTFPHPLLHALSALPSAAQPLIAVKDETEAQRLKAEMERDALAPPGGGLDDEDDEVSGQTGFSGLQRSREANRQSTADMAAPVREEDGEGLAGAETEDWDLLAAEARKLLMLPAAQRLLLTLQYLRDEYHHCFWCGCAYESKEALDTECPGELEDDHD